MISVSDLPALNAMLNGTSGILLTIGYLFIRARRIAAHKVCMLSAFGVSVLFLASYLIYHYYHGATSFTGGGWVRSFYFVILLSHIVLATAILPLALATLYHALRGQFERHVRIARWTLPIWLYVSVTGVVVYAMLYHLYPAR